MSLLLEALKKAELAKQAAKEPASTGDVPFTRDKLPDITQPMEIEVHSDDLRLSEPAPAALPKMKPVLELAPDDPPPWTTPPPPASATRPAHVDTSYPLPGDAPERKQAQQVFEAKELDVNPRKPFYFTVGALGLFALGTVGYFWYQLQPRSAFSAVPPSTQPASPPMAAAPSAPAVAPDTPAVATVAAPDGTQPAMPPTRDSGARAAPAAAPAAVPAAPRGPVFARETAPARSAANAPQSGPARPARDITITPAQMQSDPLLEGAYRAFNAGDLATARADYQQVLRSNPDSRDALLGQAAVETQAQHYDAAEGYYTRLLELNPRDAHAQAGLIGLRGQVDPLAAESRLKNLIATQPEAGFLHFALGNQYAAQGRWAEAQQAFFQAHTSDPEQPDYCYNLAISLDRMHQTAPALEHYRRALALAENRPVSFDTAQVSRRVAQLER